MRSALFNWVFARHYGGTFVLRVEDTDAGRNLPESYQVLYDSLTWLGLTWDEGPGVGGPYAPYIQSERVEIYRDVVARLLAAGLAYRCYCTREEIEAREAARPPGAPSGYDGFCRSLDPQRIAELEAMSTPSVVRMRVPDAEIAFDDLVRGPVRFAAAHVPDFVIVRGNGEPLYTLVNPVDDSLMEITHVLRGEDLLPSTPRQIVLYQALDQIGVGSGRTPMFGHLPTVLGEGNRRLSKRDKGSGLAEYQHQGYLPEALLNYLALLGWAIAEDRDIFTVAEMVEAFDIRRVNANPARFDAKQVRGDQCRAHPAAADRGAGGAAGAVPRPGRADQRPAAARAVGPAAGGDAADPGADQHPVRGGGPAGLPVHRGRAPGDRPGGRAQRRLRGCPGCRERRARRTWGSSTTRPSRPRCGRRWSRGSASSRGWPSPRCARRSPAGRSRRRCSSPSRCSAGPRPWPGSPRPASVLDA